MEEPWCRVYPSQEGAPVVTGIHPGGHKFPERGPGIIVKFFKSLAPS